MTTTKEQEHIKEITDNSGTVVDNVVILNRWDRLDANARSKVLMELRHDLEDALKHVRALEDAENL